MPEGASALRLLASGHEAFIVRTMLAENARHTLDLQYHLIEDDDTAQLLLWRALNAAERGVRVRVLVDDIGTALPQAELAAPRGAQQIEVVIAALCARAEAFRESGYARTARDSEFRQRWHEGRPDLIAADAHVVADEPPPADGDDDAPAAALQQHQQHRQHRQQQQQAAVPHPVFAAMREVVAGAQRELLLVTPYLVPSEPAMELLCSLTARGVVVRTLTNSLASTDVLAVHAGYARYRPRLLACGGQLVEMHPGSDEPPARRRRLSSGASLHVKALVVDREQVFVGSMNFDPRSRQTNTEIALHATSALLGGRLGALFDEAVAPDQAWRVHLFRPGDAAAPLRWEGAERGVAMVHATEPEASRLRRLTSVLLGAPLNEELP